MVRKTETDETQETSKEAKGGMWKHYDVEIRFTTPFASSLPKNKDEIAGMLTARMTSDADYQRRIKASEVLKTVDELAEEVAEEVGADDDAEKGWATFKRDDKGLYYEARCVKAHLKDCANILQKFTGEKALKSKVANRIEIHPADVRILKNGGFATDVDGFETRIVHAMTMKGPRSTLKNVDYVNEARLHFNIKVLNDGFVTDDLLRQLFEYGGEHGMGQERSQGWGKYEVTHFVKQ